MDTSNGNIIWSVDAFEETHELSQSLNTILVPLSQRLETTIEPVYVLSPDRINLPTEFSSEGVASFKGIAERELLHVTKEQRLKALPPRILVQNGYSTTQSVNKLIDYALDSHAQMIVTATHGTKGVERWLLGSFAETLLTHSKIPVMVVNRNYDRHPDFSSILFATDLSDASSRALEKLIPFARKLGAQITLFNYVPHPIEPIVQTGISSLGGGWVSFHNYLMDIEKSKKQVLDTWCERVKTKGVPCQSRVSSVQLNTAEAILAEAQALRAGIVALAAQTGPVASAILGSVSRQIVRRASVPVLVFRDRS